MKVKILNNLSFQTFPITDDMVDFPEEDLMQIGKTKQFVDGQIVDYVDLNKELEDLIAWFDEYDNQVKQYERCQRLGVEFDKNIEELDAQATINQQRISEIRNLLKGEK